MNIPTISLAQFAGFLNTSRAVTSFGLLLAGGQSELARVQSFDRSQKSLRLDSLTFELLSSPRPTPVGCLISRTAKAPSPYPIGCPMWSETVSSEC